LLQAVRVGRRSKTKRKRSQTQRPKTNREIVPMGPTPTLGARNEQGRGKKKGVFTQFSKPKRKKKIS